MIEIFVRNRAGKKVHIELLNFSHNDSHLVGGLSVEGQGIFLEGPRMPFTLDPRRTENYVVNLTKSAKSLTFALYVDGIKCIYEVRA